MSPEFQAADCCPRMSAILSLVGNRLPVVAQPAQTKTITAKCCQPRRGIAGMGGLTFSTAGPVEEFCVIVARFAAYDSNCEADVTYIFFVGVVRAKTASVMDSDQMVTPARWCMPLHGKGPLNADERSVVARSNKSLMVRRSRVITSALLARPSTAYDYHSAGD